MGWELKAVVITGVTEGLSLSSIFYTPSYTQSSEFSP